MWKPRSTSKLTRMYLLSFLFTLHISLAAYVNSTFLSRVFSEHYVGLLYTAASFLTLLVLSESSVILKHFGNRKFTLYLLLINTLALLGMIMAPGSPIIVGISFISLFSTNTLVFFCIDIFIEHFGTPEKIGRTRSLYLTVGNIAWLISPLITSILIAQAGGYVNLYIIALITSALTMVGFIFSVRNFEDKTYIKTPFIDTYRYLKTNRHMLAITIIDFILQFFYVWMVVYTPLYLHAHLGFGWDKLGVIFTIMLMPFVLFEFPVGILIDKYHVKKQFLISLGIIIMAFFTYIIAWTTTQNIAVWAFILFMTRAGASIVESTAEIYFFTHVTEEDAFLLGIFRDMSPVAYIIAPVIATMIFAFLPLKSIYMILSIILLSAFYYIKRLKHNHGPTPLPNQN